MKDLMSAKMRTEVDLIFLELAKKSLAEAERAFQEIVTKSRNHEKVNIELFDNERNNSLITIMFSYFALESHINKIGHDRLDAELWKEFMDMPTKKKWVLFSVLLSGKKFDKFGDFSKLKRWRNSLVHYKECEFKELVKHKSGTNVSPIYKIINPRNAKFAYNTAKRMIDELDNILK